MSIRTPQRTGRTAVAVTAALAVVAAGAYVLSENEAAHTADYRLTAGASTRIGHPEQIRIAEPGGEWTMRGDGSLAEHLDSWSRNSMSPGDVTSRSYVVQNMDARAGTWQVSVGDLEATDNAYLALGNDELPLGVADPTRTAPTQTPPEPAAVTPGDTDVRHWLAGAGTQAWEGIGSVGPGTILTEVSLESCEAASFTDWVAFPDVTDDVYMDATAQPKLRVTFTPDSGDPGEFIDGGCAHDTEAPGTPGTPEEPENPDQPGSPEQPGPGGGDGDLSSERCEAAITEVTAMWGLLAVLGAVAVVALPVLQPILSQATAQLRSLNTQVLEALEGSSAAGAVKRLQGAGSDPAVVGGIAVAAALLLVLGSGAYVAQSCAPGEGPTSSRGSSGN